MASTFIISGLNSPLLITEGLTGSATTTGSVLIIEGLNSPRLLTWGLGGGAPPPPDLTIYPDPFASTVVSSTADPFSSTAD